MKPFFQRLIYGKEGPDIEKDAPEKRAFFRFWEIGWNKRFKLVGINFIYFLFDLIPTALAAAGYILAVSFYFTLARGTSVWENIENSANPYYARVMYFMGLAFTVVFYNIVPVFSAGPFRAGLTYITLSFVKREPVFLWSDFMAKSRANLKLGLKVMVIQGLLGIWDMLLIAFYLACAGKDTNMAGLLPDVLLFICAGVAAFFTVFLWAMSMYIYPMIVTFNITVKQLYKNAMIFALIKWLPNLGILILTVAMVLIPLLLINGYFSFIVTLLIYAVILQSFTSYLHNFFVYPTIKKYMIDNPKADKSKKEENAEGEDSGADEADADAAGEGANPSGGAFINGMWVSNADADSIAAEAEPEAGTEGKTGGTGEE